MSNLTPEQNAKIDKIEEAVGKPSAETKAGAPDEKSTELAYADPIDPAGIANRNAEEKKDEVLEDNRDTAEVKPDSFDEAVAKAVQKEINRMKEAGEIAPGPGKPVIIQVGGEAESGISLHNRKADGLLVQEGDGQKDGLDAKQRAERNAKLAAELTEDPKHGLSVQVGDGQRRAKDNPNFGEKGVFVGHMAGDAFPPSPVSPQGPAVPPDPIPLEAIQATQNLKGETRTGEASLGDTPFDPSPTSPQGPGSVEGTGMAAVEQRYGEEAVKDPAQIAAEKAVEEKNDEAQNSTTPQDQTDDQIVHISSENDPSPTSPQGSPAHEGTAAKK